MYRVNDLWVSPENDFIARKVSALEIDSGYERHFRDFVRTWLPNKELMLDVGANIGIYARPCSTFFNRVIAVEPAPNTMECLQINLKDCNNVEMLQCGIGPATTAAQFMFNAKNSGNTKQITEASDHINAFKCDIVPMDSLALSGVNYIKIDVEGFELAVLESGRKTIEGNLPWIQVEINEKETEILEFLNSFTQYNAAYVKNRGNLLMIPSTGPNAATPNTPLMKDNV